MNEFKLRKILKILVPVKILVIALAFAYSNGSIYFGEKNLKAVEDSKPPAKESTGQATDKVEPGKPDVTKAATEKPAEKAPESPARKSFLDGMLNLPDISDTASKNEEIGKYLSLAERKKQQVEERLTLLESRENQLKKIEVVIDEKLARLEDERLFFSQTIQKEKVIQADRLESLVGLYAKMEPKKAGAVFETLDNDLVVSLFNKMEKKTVTRILEAVTAPRSVALTEYFGRIRSGKEYDLLKEMNTSLRNAFDECKGMVPADAASVPPIMKLNAN